MANICFNTIEKIRRALYYIMRALMTRRKLYRMKTLRRAFRLKQDGLFPDKMRL